MMLQLNGFKARHFSYLFVYSMGWMLVSPSFSRNILGVVAFRSYDVNFGKAVAGAAGTAMKGREEKAAVRSLSSLTGGFGQAPSLRRPLFVYRPNRKTSGRPSSFKGTRTARSLASSASDNEDVAKDLEEHVGNFGDDQSRTRALQESLATLNLDGKVLHEAMNQSQHNPMDGYDNRFGRSAIRAYKSFVHPKPTKNKDHREDMSVAGTFQN
jgi:hypothetical protein